MNSCLLYTSRRYPTIQHGVRCNDAFVSADHSDNVTAAIRPELRSWLAGGEPWVVALGAAAFEVLDKENRGALHAQLTSEKLASAAHQARAWQFKNPGPVQVIADEFAGIFNKFTALADEYVVAAEFTPDDPSPDLDLSLIHI